MDVARSALPVGDVRLQPVPVTAANRVSVLAQPNQPRAIPAEPEQPRVRRAQFRRRRPAAPSPQSSARRRSRAPSRPPPARCPGSR